MMVVCEEMQKLRNWLDNEEIPWEDWSEDGSRYMKDFPVAFQNWIVDTKFYIKNKEVSVINGYGTYGGYSLDEDRNLNLLEVRVGESEPIGFLTFLGVKQIVEKLISGGKFNGMD